MEQDIAIASRNRQWLARPQYFIVDDIDMQPWIFDHRIIYRHFTGVQNPLWFFARQLSGFTYKFI